MSMRVKVVDASWRGAKEDVEFVSNPHPEWFRTLARTGESQRRVARFALVSDGSLWFGDGTKVIHADVLRFHPGSRHSGCVPVCAGAFFAEGESGLWRPYGLQHFAIDSDASLAGRALVVEHLLQSLAVWPSVVGAMGSDPFVPGWMPLPEWGPDEREEKGGDA